MAVVLAAAFLFFISLGARDLWAPNEPIYGQAVVEMAERGDWLLPTVNEKVFAEKPILYYWGALLASKALGGVDEASLRVPSALAGILSVALLYLLVVPYAGRRRALLASALFLTLYQVFWAGRAIQMDVLVLAATLGVVLPLTRMLDFEAPPVPAWAWAGLAAGLGFTAKGPVALIVPGIVVLGYALVTRRLRAVLRWPFLVGIGITVVVASPWYLTLWLRGETTFLYEVLIRQNFGRFVDAWDHHQPWWYFGQYLFTDYAPWSLLLPAAALTRAATREEKSLHTLGWVWVLGVILFFSLSDSKRAPYILPVAPAVAFLTASVVERWISGGLTSKGSRIAARVAFSFLAFLLFVAGLATFAPRVEIPEGFGTIALVLGTVLGVTGLAMALGVLKARKWPRLTPGALWAGITAIYLLAAVWALPAANPEKSARGIAAEINRQLAATGGTVASFQFWDWRVEYVYYARRPIPNFRDPAALRNYWQSSAAPFVLVEQPDAAELRALLPDAELVHSAGVGSRTALLFGKYHAGSGPP